MLLDARGLDLSASQSHALGSPGRVRLPWLCSRLCLCGSNAAESLAPCECAGHSETHFLLLVCVGCVLPVARAAISVCTCCSR